MAKLRVILFISLIIELTGCKQEQKNIEGIPSSEIQETDTLTLEQELKASDEAILEHRNTFNSNNLSSKVYLYAPDLDTLKCQVSGECDCCSGNILFLDSQNFVTISYCVSDKFISQGTYQISDGFINLDYDSLEIESIYQINSETDKTSKSDYKLNVLKKPKVTVKLTTFSCKQNLLFRAGTDEIAYGAVDPETSIEKEIENLKNEGIWNKLKKN